MFEWLRRFWYGRILFLARGEHLAHFVNQVSKEGIVLYHTQKSERGMRAQIKLADFRRLRRPARRTHTRVHIVAKYGWPFVAARWWRRKGLLIGIVIIASVLTILSQLVLSISVTGNKNLIATDVIERAEKLGLRTWVYSKDLDLNGIAKSLQEQLPDAAWIGIERQGTSIQIRVSEKTRPSIPDEVGNLVASRAGIVKEIMVIDGTPLIHEGETVRAGQVLIKSPEVNNMSSAKNAPVSVARGFVRARVWYSAEGQIPLVEDKVEESGRVAKGRGIKIGSRVIMLTAEKSPFEQSREEVISQSLKLWRNWRFPVEGIRVNHIELHNVHIERTVSKARQLAEQIARAEVQKKLTQGVPIVAETVKVLSDNSGSERVRVEVETYEDLAVYANP
ncbi:sporulation protein YqfD [Desulfosporosinus hippei]|uniref:Similar to stage IV sporulation protein n=1 Tax=Desulfosporosinus hippei DSM 8344 TaxID=1121419 RepID=A0A1G7SB14_9FIRM|nr:sporulation protein YqfD [Desulfosporosinus hippei]SDG19370.1 similar to stage IV sporulation protein [Desulfosporosinus hippei DSM 8344]